MAEQERTTGHQETGRRDGAIPTPADTLTLKNILSETRYVSDWKTLGVGLGVHISEIRLIEAKCGNNISHCKMELFDVWLNCDPNASWLALGQVLLDTPDHDIGVKILQAHCPSSLPPYLLSRGGGIEKSFPNSSLTTPTPSLRTCPYPTTSLGTSPYPDSNITRQQLQRKEMSVGNNSRNSVLAPHLHTNAPHSLEQLPTMSSVQRVIDHSGELVTLPQQHVLHFCEYGGSMASYPAPMYPDTQPLSSNQPLPMTSYPVPMYSDSQQQGQLLSNQVLPMASYPTQQQPMYPDLPQRVAPVPGTRPMVTDGDLVSGGVEQINIKEQGLIRSEFATLLSKVFNAFRTSNIPLSEIKEHFELMNLPDSRNKKIFSDENLDELISVEKVIEFLKKNISFDECGLLEGLIERFLPHLTDLIQKYLHERDSFFETCTGGQFASGFQQIIPTVLGPNTVAAHLDSQWQRRPMQHIRQLQHHEFQQYIPGAPFPTRVFQQRSIFIIWQTSLAAVEALQRDYASRYLHLKSQRVLQLVLGSLELDFTGSTPMDVYKLERRVDTVSCGKHYDDTVSLSGISESVSMLTHQSDNTYCSEKTHDSRTTHQSGTSGQSKAESGYMSASPSIQSLVSTVAAPQTLQALGITGEITEDYSNEKEYLHLAKGDIVTVIYSDESKHRVFVRTKDHHFGYIPTKIINVSQELLQLVQTVAPVDDVEPAQAATIVRRRIQLNLPPSKSDHTKADITCSSTDGTSDDLVKPQPTTSDKTKRVTFTEEVETLQRPDTPPGVWYYEGYYINLNPRYNSHAVDPVSGTFHQLQPNHESFMTPVQFMELYYKKNLSFPYDRHQGRYLGKSFAKFRKFWKRTSHDLETIFSENTTQNIKDNESILRLDPLNLDNTYNSVVSVV